MFAYTPNTLLDRRGFLALAGPAAAGLITGCGGDISYRFGSSASPAQLPTLKARDGTHMFSLFVRLFLDTGGTVEVPVGQDPAGVLCDQQKIDRLSDHALRGGGIEFVPCSAHRGESVAGPTGDGWRCCSSVALVGPNGGRVTAAQHTHPGGRHVASLPGCFRSRRLTMSGLLVAERVA